MIHTIQYNLLTYQSATCIRNLMISSLHSYFSYNLIRHEKSNIDYDNNSQINK